VPRKKYWGELTDCVSKSQLALDSYTYEKAKCDRAQKSVFKCEKVFEVSSKDKKGKSQVSHQSVNLATDIRDYEFLKKQEAYFYEEGNMDLNVNTIMRRIKFSLGLISEEEFYEQEALADQLEQ